MQSSDKEGLELEGRKDKREKVPWGLYVLAALVVLTWHAAKRSPGYATFCATPTVSPAILYAPTEPLKDAFNGACSEEILQRLKQKELRSVNQMTPDEAACALLGPRLEPAVPVAPVPPAAPQALHTTSECAGFLVGFFLSVLARPMALIALTLAAVYKIHQYVRYRIDKRSEGHGEKVDLLSQALQTPVNEPAPANEASKPLPISSPGKPKENPQELEEPPVSITAPDSLYCPAKPSPVSSPANHPEADPVESMRDALKGIRKLAEKGLIPGVEIIKPETESTPTRVSEEELLNAPSASPWVQ